MRDSCEGEWSVERSFGVCSPVGEVFCVSAEWSESRDKMRCPATEARISVDLCCGYQLIGTENCKQLVFPISSNRRVCSRHPRFVPRELDLQSSSFFCSELLQPIQTVPKQYS